MSGVLLQPSGAEAGVGVVKIPIAGIGIVRGSYQTISVELSNQTAP
jgi:hypothetical protein